MSQFNLIILHRVICNYKSWIRELIKNNINYCIIIMKHIKHGLHPSEFYTRTIILIQNFTFKHRMTWLVRPVCSNVRGNSDRPDYTWLYDIKTYVCVHWRFDRVIVRESQTSFVLWWVWGLQWSQTRGTWSDLDTPWLSDTNTFASFPLWSFASAFPLAAHLTWIAVRVT